MHSAPVAARKFRRISGDRPSALKNRGSSTLIPGMQLRAGDDTLCAGFAYGGWHSHRLQGCRCAGVTSRGATLAQQFLPHMCAGALHWMSRARIRAAGGRNLPPTQAGQGALRVEPSFTARQPLRRKPFAGVCRIRPPPPESAPIQQHWALSRRRRAPNHHHRISTPQRVTCPRAAARALSACSAPCPRICPAAPL